MTAVLVALTMAVGVIGTLLPIVPGLGLVWAAGVVYGLVEGFGVVGWMCVTVMTLLLIGGSFAGIRIPQRAAALGGIGLGGQVFAAGLAVVGFFAIPVVGAALGFVLGVYVVARRREPTRAWAVTRRTVGSLAAAAGVQFLAALAMAATWGVWLLLT